MGFYLEKTSKIDTRRQ
nr:unnamed protein product [Callosobruchus chinensis]